MTLHSPAQAVPEAAARIGHLLAQAAANHGLVWAYAAAARQPGGDPVDQVVWMEDPDDRDEFVVFWARHDGSFTGSVELDGVVEGTGTALVLRWSHLVHKLAAAVENADEENAVARAYEMQACYLRWVATYAPMAIYRSEAMDAIQERCAKGVPDDLQNFWELAGAPLDDIAADKRPDAPPPGWDHKGCWSPPDGTFIRSLTAIQAMVEGAGGTLATDLTDVQHRNPPTALAALAALAALDGTRTRPS